MKTNEKIKDNFLIIIRVIIYAAESNNYIFQGPLWFLNFLRNSEPSIDLKTYKTIFDIFINLGFIEWIKEPSKLKINKNIYCISSFDEIEYMISYNIKPNIYFRYKKINKIINNI